MTTWPDRRLRPLAQCEVGEDLRGAADDRRVRVHRGVAGHHADVLRPEDVHEREELLGHERLDRRRVEGADAAGQRGEMRGDRDQRLPGPGGGAEDQVRARDDVDHRLVLGRVQADAPRLDPVHERLVHRVLVEHRRVDVAIDRRRDVGDGQDAGQGAGVGHDAPRLSCNARGTHRIHVVSTAFARRLSTWSSVTPPLRARRLPLSRPAARPVVARGCGGHRRRARRSRCRRAGEFVHRAERQPDPRRRRGRHRPGARMARKRL